MNDPIEEEMRYLLTCVSCRSVWDWRQYRKDSESEFVSNAIDDVVPALQGVCCPHCNCEPHELYQLTRRIVKNGLPALPVNAAEIRGGLSVLDYFYDSNQIFGGSIFERLIDIREFCIPGDEYVWCIRCRHVCQRMDYRLVGEFPDEKIICPYSHCDGDVSIDRWPWESVLKFHPDYPATPEKGAVYVL